VHLPLSGLFFIPLTALVVLLRPGRLEEFVVYMAVFQGAAVINVGGSFGFGILPFFLGAGLLAARLALEWINGGIRFRRNELARTHLQLMGIFVAWCVLSAFLLPILFEGTPVDSPRAGAEAVFYSALPLKWSFSNAGQAGYIVIDFCVLVAFSSFSVKYAPQRLIEAYSCSGLIVSLVGFYQMTASHVGLPFPSWFFNSNVTWAQNYKQLIGAGVHRVSATFVEPSVAGEFLSGWVLFELILANWGTADRTRHGIFASLGCIVLFATTSSTGYVTLAAAVLFMLGRLVYGVVQQGKIWTRLAVMISIVMIIAAGFLMLNRDSSLLDAVLWSKARSSSGVVRTATVWRAAAVLGDTYGLGAGLGSNRAFGAWAYIGSNLGVVGLALFTYLLVQLLRRAISCCLTLPTRAARVSLIACTASFASTVVSAALSGAEITAPGLWIVWAILLGCVRVAPRKESVARPLGSDELALMKRLSNRAAS